MQPDAVHNEVGPGQWVRDQIRLANPDLTVGDLDNDGTADTIDDYIVYYRNNRTRLEKTIPFFRWAAAMDPDNMCVFNPIHDYLNIVSQLHPPDEIQDVYRQVRFLIIGARISANSYAAKDVFEALLDELHEDGFDIGGKPIIAKILIIGAAHQFDLITSDKPAINETFLTYRDGEVTRVSPYELLSLFYLRAGRTFERRGDLIEAGDYYNVATDMNPNNPSAYGYLGDLMIRMSNYVEAIRIYNEAIKRNPDDAISYNGRGEAWLALKQYSLALTDFNRALDLDDESARTHTNLGILYYELNFRKKALKHFAEAIYFDESYAPAYFHRAHLYYAKGWKITAMKDYKRAHRLDSSLADAPYHVGQIYYWLARKYDSTWYYQQARRYFSRAINSAEQYARPEYFVERGIVHHILQQFDRAERDFSKAIKCDPTFVLAWIERGILRHLRNDKKRDYLKSLADFDQAIKLDPKNIRAYTRRAELYLDLKQQDRAFVDYQKITELDPKNMDAFYNLGLIYQRRKNDIEALKAFTKAIDINPKKAHADYYYRRGLIWFKLEKINKAFDDFDKAIKIDKKHAKAYYYRSIIWKMWREHGKALLDFNKACDNDKSLCLRRTPPDQEPAPPSSPSN